MAGQNDVGDGILGTPIEPEVLARIQRLPRKPEAVVLEGSRVVLRPVDPAADSEPLFAASDGRPMTLGGRSVAAYDRRVEWKCDSLNARSRTTALRMGFQFEGIQEQQRIIKGRNRDTAWFRIVAEEWPTVDRQLRRLLATPEAGAGSARTG